MPVAWVPGEVSYEANFEYLVEWKFLPWDRKIFGQFECCPVRFLGEDSDNRVTI